MKSFKEFVAEEVEQEDKFSDTFSVLLHIKVVSILTVMTVSSIS